MNLGGTHTFSPQQALFAEKSVFAPLTCPSSSVRGQVAALTGLLLGARFGPVGLFFARCPSLDDVGLGQSPDFVLLCCVGDAGSFGST